MTRARVFALLAFIAIGAAGGSLIVGDTVWFAWSAGTGAIALMIWGRTHDQPAPPPTPVVDDLKRNNLVAFCAEIAYGWGRTHDRPAPLPPPALPPHYRRGFTEIDVMALDEPYAPLRPIWPVPTNHFGAPE